MIKKSVIRTAVLLCALLSQLFCTSAVAQGGASAVDTQAPKILHAPSDAPTPKNQNLIIMATVTDNSVVDEVTLFHRLEGEQKYSAVMMSSTGVEDLYTAEIQIQDATATGIEYYIQASDKAGNSGLYGLSFSPVLVEIGAPEEVNAALAGDAPSTKPVVKKSKKKWIWIGLGVAAAAVLAGSAGGGGDSGGNDTGDVDVIAPVP